MARPPLALLVGLTAGLLLGVACSKDSVEDRAREQAERIQRGMVDVEAVALGQQVPADVVAEVQRHLTAIDEYQGETNGTLDSVTVNAIQAFQRSAGLRDDGIITKQTRAKLAEAAEKAKPAS